MNEITKTNVSDKWGTTKWMKLQGVIFTSNGAQLNKGNYKK